MFPGVEKGTCTQQKSPDGIVNYETKAMAADALKWAAYTYVIAAIGSLATLLYYISLANRRN